MFSEFLLVIIFCSLSASAKSNESEIDKLEKKVPEAKDVIIVVKCADCIPNFKINEHKLILNGLSDKRYVRQMQIALYMQDILHQSSSKAHFDNCDFSGAISYISQLKAEIGEHADAATYMLSKKKPALANLELKLAFISLGQALHGIQDFYAHTNFVEMSIGAANTIEDFKIIKTWDDQAQERIINMQQEGLKSGFVSWGTPKKCKSPHESHGDMSKDSKTSIRGKKTISKLGNITYFDVAQELAKEASKQFIDDVFGQWRILGAVSQGTLKFDVLVDRRVIAAE